MRGKLLILSFCCIFVSLFSQNETSEVVVEEIIDSMATVEVAPPINSLETDSLLRSGYKTSNVVTPKKLSPNYRSKYKGKDFDYTLLKPKESLWEKIERRLLKIWKSIFGDVDTMGVNNWTVIILRILGIVLIGVVLYFIIKFLFDKEVNFIFSKKNKKNGLRATELHENIHEINFPESILAYEKQHEFRLAIRYQFLYVLKKMTDKNIIQWNQEKTNNDYLTELNNPQQKESYRKLAFIFDYVWYGEFNINEKDYQNFKNQFQNSGF